MELNQDLIIIQGILKSCVRRTGDFIRINRKGGNEENINLITQEISKYLHSKKYMEENKPNDEHASKLQNIVLFLAVNTNFKQSLSIDEYSHLMGIIPQLSKCLLANVCYNLGLCEQYGIVICKMPIELSQELIDNIVECVKKSSPEDQLAQASIILNATARRLSSTEVSNQVEEHIEDVVRASNNLLKNLTGIGVDYANSMKKKQIYQHMGFTLLSLFNVLLNMDENLAVLKRFLECLLATSCNIFSTVTLDVFCAWAEIKYNDRPLQIIIAEKSYSMVEKYQKFELAKELVMMLSTVAKKPKTVSQLACEADITTIIKNVNEAGPEQNIWFQAFVKTEIFKNKEAMKCLEQWSHLCDEKDFRTLLNSIFQYDRVEHRNLILKCASNLPSETLQGVMWQHFFEKSFKFEVDIEDQLVVTFNRLGSELKEEEMKEVLLLLLQNPVMFFWHVYLNIVKGLPLSDKLFSSIACIAWIDDIGIKTLRKLISENPPSDQNLKNYFKLFERIMDSRSCSWDAIVSKVLLPIIEQYKGDDSLDSLRCTLLIVKNFCHKCCQPDNETNLFGALLICCSRNRCESFFFFDSSRAEIVKTCVDCILERVKTRINERGLILVKTENLEAIDDSWSKYYKGLCEGRNLKLLDSMLPGLDLERYRSGSVDESFTKLMKILPSCVASEWCTLFRELADRYDYITAINLFSDIITLLCNVIKLIPPLKYCLQNFIAVLALGCEKTPEDQILTTKKICNILKHIPEELRGVEGMLLINVLPEEALKSLAQDKEFVAHIVLIKDKQLCKALAQKVLGRTEEV